MEAQMLWPDFNLDGLKPVYQLSFDRRFGYQPQPVGLCARWFFAKGKWTNLSMKYFSDFSISYCGGSLNVVGFSDLKVTKGVLKASLSKLKATGAQT